MGKCQLNELNVDRQPRVYMGKSLGQVSDITVSPQLSDSGISLRGGPFRNRTVSGPCQSCFMSHLCRRQYYGLVEQPIGAIPLCALPPLST